MKNKVEIFPANNISVHTLCAQIKVFCALREVGRRYHIISLGVSSSRTPPSRQQAQVNYTDLNGWIGLYVYICIAACSTLLSAALRWYFCEWRSFIFKINAYYSLLSGVHDVVVCWGACLKLVLKGCPSLGWGCSWSLVTCKCTAGGTSAVCWTERSLQEVRPSHRGLLLSTECRLETVNNNNYYEYITILIWPNACCCLLCMWLNVSVTFVLFTLQPEYCTGRVVNHVILGELF